MGRSPKPFISTTDAAVTEPPESTPQLIRGALNRKALADARQRMALARVLDLTESEVLAIQHLARSGQLTPTQLGNLLQLSSGGTTALIHRLERAGHVIRQPHERDRRSAVLRLSPAIQERAARAWAPLVAEIDTLASRLSAEEQDALVRFLEQVGSAAERHADQLVREAEASAHDALAVPAPALWA